jgi:3-oxoacyl-[acyl-carrier-protein] synthase II
MVIPREAGVEMAPTMSLALQDAEVSPAQVDYVNAHATSTVRGDEVEVRGLHCLLKTRVKKVAVNATKSLIGHTLGAAGAIAVVATTMAIESGRIHPTINYEDPDPECRLPGIAATVQERRVKVALVNAFGFGSNNASLVLRRYD